MSKKPSSKSKPNPYKNFISWLYNSYPNATLSDSVIKSINPRAVLSRYSNMGNLTIFLEEHFNKYDLMGLNHLEFYNFIKLFVKKYRIEQYDYSYFRSTKRDKTLLEIQRKLPHLKEYEISYLLDKCKSDPEYDAFLENLGIKKQEKIKKNKKRKIKGSKIISTFDDGFINSIKTWEDWRACFEY